jgi:sec-independent protein translocase protein TatC
MADDPSLPTGEQEAAEDPNAMPVMEHLRELRRRLILSTVGILPGITLAWYYKENLLEYLVAPLAEAWQALAMKSPALHFANPMDPFVAYLEISIVVGIIWSSPWIFWQIWKFVSPGLYQREKRLALPFVAASTLFFAGGAFFGYGVILPLGFQTFLSMAGMLPNKTATLQPTIMIDQYLTFSLQMLLAFGVVFEIPVVVAFLALAGIVNWKQLMKFGRWWVLIAAIIAGILTPPDVGSQLLMLGPLVILYYLSVGVAFFLGPKPQTAKDEIVTTE